MSGESRFAHRLQITEGGCAALRVVLGERPFLGERDENQSKRSGRGARPRGQAEGSGRGAGARG